ncbi:hypothetical protein GCM10027276_15410 [Comamonas piscis]
MKCRDYIFQLTSGQLEDAGTATKIAAWQHRMICFRCRAFTRNDQALQDILSGYGDQLQHPHMPTAKPSEN